MDIEWAKDGHTGELFIVQARPETVQSQKSLDMVEIYHLEEKRPVLVRGRSVGEKIAHGPVRVVKSAHNLNEVQNGDVLVTDKTDPDWEPTMKKAAAIVTNRGGRTCHAAIVSRELGLPAIVGTENATEALKDGQAVTVSCAEGETGFVYQGLLKFDVQRIKVHDLPRPQTKVMMNVGNPEEAFRLSFIANDGVGLAREEFIISNYIKVHPLALLDFNRLEDRGLREEIERLTVGYEDKPQFFIDKLAQGVAMIGAAFYPKDVIVRLSDFKTNEYANLIGGKAYEPIEENPMIGFRGASRYYDPRYQAGFALECRAMKKVRDEMGLTNVKLMVPFLPHGRGRPARARRNGKTWPQARRQRAGGLCHVRDSEQCDSRKRIRRDLRRLLHRLQRSHAARCSESIAIRRSSRTFSTSAIQAVKTMIASVIRAAKSKGRKIGICGQAPSDYPDFAAFLVELGIDSISLNPDAVLKTTLRILEMEAEIKRSQVSADTKPQAVEHVI